jgi:hypothetical protein
LRSIHFINYLQSQIQINKKALYSRALIRRACHKLTCKK